MLRDKTPDRFRLWISRASMTIALILAAARVTTAQGPQKLGLRLRVDIATVASLGHEQHAVASLGIPSPGHVVGASRLPDGTLLVADDEPGHVFQYDSAGHPLRVLGTRGSNQKDYRHILWMGKCRGDSVHVWDFMSGRMSLISPQARVEGQYLLASSEAKGNSIYRVACSQERGLAYQSLPSTRLKVPPPFARGLASVYLEGIGRTAAIEIPAIPTDELVVLDGAVFPRPDGKRTLLAIGHDKLYVGTSDSAIIAVYGFDGSRINSIAVPAQETSPDETRYASAVADVVDGIHDPARREAVRRDLLRLGPPVEMSPYQAILTDKKGDLWVAVSRARDRTTLLRFDEQGKVTARIDHGQVLSPMEIGSDYLLAAYRDAKGIRHVGMFSIDAR
jgi:hypothetical protein